MEWEEVLATKDWCPGQRAPAQGKKEGQLGSNLRAGGGEMARNTTSTLASLMKSPKWEGMLWVKAGGIYHPVRAG